MFEDESSFDIIDKAIKSVIFKYKGKDFYDDLYQECYCKVLEMLKTNMYNPILNLYGYAYTISRNQTTYYMYHNHNINRITTVRDDSIFGLVESQEEIDTSNIELVEFAEEILKQYWNVLDPLFATDDLLGLLYKDDSEINELKYRIIKGELLWKISKTRT